MRKRAAPCKKKSLRVVFGEKGREGPLGGLAVKAHQDRHAQNFFRLFWTAFFLLYISWKGCLI